jgi:hypothetical protein
MKPGDIRVFNDDCGSPLSGACILLVSCDGVKWLTLCSWGEYFSYFNEHSLRLLTVPLEA